RCLRETCCARLWLPWIYGSLRESRHRPAGTRELVIERWCGLVFKARVFPESRASVLQDCTIASSSWITVETFSTGGSTFIPPVRSAAAPTRSSFPKSIATVTISLGFVYPPSKFPPGPTPVGTCNHDV